MTITLMLRTSMYAALVNVSIHGVMCACVCVPIVACLYIHICVIVCTARKDHDRVMFSHGSHAPSPIAPTPLVHSSRHLASDAVSRR